MSLAPLGIIWLALGYSGSFRTDIVQPAMFVGGVLALAASFALMRRAVTRSSRIYQPRAIAAPTSQPSRPAVVASPRPDVAGFAAEVRRHAERVAEGWSGNRKAYVSRVWQSLSGARPEWAISEIEFKCMLAEAHRTGAIVLSNADLKDGRNIKEIQDSALSYKNSIFHFVRVDD